MKKRKANANESVMYEALQEAKKYISAEGTGKSHRSKIEVLKRIRAALAPSDHVYKQRAKKLEQLIKIADEINDKMYRMHYIRVWSALSNDKKLSLDNYFSEVYNQVEKLQSAIIKLRL